MILLGVSNRDCWLSYSKLNDELTRLSVWFNVNKLTLNTKKTKSVIFSSRNKVIDTTGLKLTINGNIIEQVPEIKFLGVFLDQHLSFKSHIDYVTVKMSRAIGMLNRLKYFIPNNVLLTIYNALVLPHINYAITAWGSASPTELQKIHMLRKKQCELYLK